MLKNLCIAIALFLCISVTSAKQNVKNVLQMEGVTVTPVLEGCTDYCHHLTSGPCQHPDQHNEICVEKVRNGTMLLCPAGTQDCGDKPSRTEPSPAPSKSPSSSASLSSSPEPMLDWGFEDGNLDAWEKDGGNAFDYQPILGDNPTARNRGQPSNHQGNYWIGTWENYQGLDGRTPGSGQGDGPQGIITSPPFVISTNKVSFLVGGGAHRGRPGRYDRGTFVAMLVLNEDGSEREIFRQSGFNHETMRRVVKDISGYIEATAVVKIVDKESGGWGHINCDDFLWYN
jgi:hypothetical protein